MVLEQQRAKVRRAVTRRRRLAADAVLWRLEGAWLRAVDPRDVTAIDPATGRTPRERIESSLTGNRIWANVQELMDDGDDGSKVLSEIHSVVNDFGAKTADTLRRSAPAMLRNHRLRQRGFERRLRAVWGPALDAFYAVYVGVEELGSDLQQLYQDREDDLTAALLALQARASLLMAEIHHTLSAGFPLAAWARARTLHETAIIAEILGEHGREPGTDDLATRYLAHAVVDQAGDLQLASKKGLRVDPELAANVETSLQGVLKHYGDSFGADYGWARPLFPELSPKRRVTFARLELLAASGLSRFDYRVGGHHVHASAWTLHLNRFQRGDTDFRLTGPVNKELDGPASVALAAALTTTTAVLYGITSAPPDPMHLLALAALRELTYDVEPLLDEAVTVLERREERLQRRAGPEKWRRNRAR